MLLRSCLFRVVGGHGHDAHFKINIFPLDVAGSERKVHSDCPESGGQRPPFKINCFPAGVAGGGRKVHSDRPESGGPRYPLLPNPGFAGSTGLPGVSGLHQVSSNL